MSVDVTTDLLPRGLGLPVRPERVPLHLVRDPHPAYAAQQAFADESDRVLRLAGASGQRLATALYLVLRQHHAVPELDPDGGSHLTCAECRPTDRDPADQYPCPTAEHAFWALDAVLR
ncbi:hypothetical protein [uncultured Friedmanniella sp.]|uniref:hypothetical protein n=1 Tax=uncultured Friedmanniella sp. TaxID=335381 RepID=UPI0035CBEFEE